MIELLLGGPLTHKCATSFKLYNSKSILELQHLQAEFKHYSVTIMIQVIEGKCYSYRRNHSKFLVGANNLINSLLIQIVKPFDDSQLEKSTTLKYIKQHTYT